MATTALTGIGLLVTNDPALGDGPLGLRRDAAIVFEDGVVAWVGDSADAPAADTGYALDGRAVLPGFVESHSHLVFAGDRAEEFAARMSGQKYAAGGIRTTIEATRAATDEQLGANVRRLMDESLRAGSTTVECKSGYGQSVADELRSVQVAGRYTDEVTLLAAHVAPPEYAGRIDEYVAMAVAEMIPKCAPHAKWIDVFCEQGAFDRDQAHAVLTAGIAHGLIPRVHGNQLRQGPGVQLAVELGAASVDHVTHVNAADIDALAHSDTVATLLPGADFCTRSSYPDARALLDAGVTVALGADCNPGTSYTTSLPFCIAIAVRDMHMTPDEAVWAATAGGARALRRTDVGTLTPGARADALALDAPTHLHLAYRPGVPLISRVWRNGTLAYSN
ncbi:imidazolonepropionase [Nocardia cyriacigeorgica]|uniref:Imidazolonepropionase n=1 Tax=Nocardia cyriacigeorgica TaxID=135487 RepID=A0A4V6ICR4_9NOCA|nr:imidazolonepropionase [Nocardia cyriacigeorgica]MBF6100945.1 imidazolonepropionase [Nocardia cyriacigeorgica]MBF6160403.1 imidazolonepropionase [Nocardia cyriacigeorgica]MBF6199488.1 imidazolonepropionase [Nocardia cyriacigeorgica]MBF6515780.1 imidazolonepropionase [Nocardia cyriacigeorgica]VFB00724.1 Imidazolonepropionase [Nocardia cyriacigeorgica]